jgi:spore coat polysaccharide biosynthesis predicted glycosyltransferase SpsG
MSTTDDDLTQILLMFGASDPSNFTSAALSCLLESYPGYDIDVILGAGFSHHSAFDTVLENHKDQQGCVTVTQDVRDVASRMLAADVVITSPGLTMMEAIALRRPIIAFYQNELQEIWQCYPFVHCPDRLNHLVTLIEEAHGSFAELTSDHNIDFLEGKNQVIDAISSM